MKEIIDNIIKEEEEAKGKVETARQKVSAMLWEAEGKARNLKTEEIRKARKEKEELLHKVEIEASNKKKQAIEDASRKAEEILKEKSATVCQIAGKMFAKILKIENK